MFPETSIQRTVEVSYSKFYNEYGSYGKDTFLTCAKLKESSERLTALEFFEFSLNVVV